MKTLRVLVPLDGSSLSETILPFVARLDAPAVTLLRVLEDPSLFGGGATETEEAARERLERAAASLRERGVREVATVVRHGKPAEAILEAADDVEPGLLALTTHGHGGPGRRPLGSVAAAVVHASDFPVLAVRPDRAVAAQAPLFERILVPSDGAPLSWRAIEELEVLGAAGKGRLILFGVLEEVLLRAHAGAAHHQAGEAIRDPVERFLSQRCESLRTTLDREVRRARDLGFDATADVDIGHPAAKIVERAAAEKATLIAIATHGRTGISRLVLGSVTEEVLAAAALPLLIVR